jgi:hypothetical protein
MMVTLNGSLELLGLARELLELVANRQDGTHGLDTRSAHIDETSGEGTLAVHLVALDCGRRKERLGVETRFVDGREDEYVLVTQFTL